MKNKVGRPKKIDRNPFLFNDNLRTNRIDIVRTGRSQENKDGSTSFTFRPIDLSSNTIHIDEKILNLMYKKETKSSTTSLIIYILSNLYRNQEQIDLNHGKVSLNTGYSVEVTMRTITVLTKLNIIKRCIGGKSGNIYWINPLLIFKGNRVLLIQNKVKNEQATLEEEAKIFNFIKTKNEKEMEEKTKTT